MYELINNVPLKVKEYKGQRVVTFKDIDRVHNRPEGTAKRNFNKNMEHFIEGEDYFKVCSYEIRTNKIMDISPKTHADVILLTENGYLMLVKSLTDDLAWDVQRQLVNTYFRAKEINISNDKLIELIRNEINSSIEKNFNRALNKRMDDLVKELNKNAYQRIDIIIKAVNKSLTDAVKTLIPCFAYIYEELTKLYK